MPIKGIFNQSQKNENINKKIAELEHKYLKLNALEVRVNRLAKLEEKMYSILKLKDEIIKAGKKDSSSKQVTDKTGREIKSVEASLLRKLDPYIEKVNYLSTYVFDLEQKFLKESEVGEVVEHTESIEFLLAHINELERKISLQNEKEIAMLARLDTLENKFADLQEIIKNGEHSVVIKELRIDKFYLDKYEQNNNFAQLGIKELSGALNIGATYGKDTIPKEVTEQLKEDLKDLTDIKKEKEGHKSEQAEVEPSDMPESPPDEHVHFTEIPIEEDNKED